MNIGYETLALAQKIAPTGAIQNAFARVYNEAVKDSQRCDTEDEASKYVIRQILYGLIDGLNYGNWPE